MTEYRVLNITHHDGTPRTDGRYPLRVGRICAFVRPPSVGECLYIEWLRNADGSFYGGWFRTSVVYKIESHEDGRLIITTNNSIYTFAVNDWLTDGVVQEV